MPSHDQVGPEQLNGEFGTPIRFNAIDARSTSEVKDLQFASKSQGGRNIQPTASNGDGRVEAPFVSGEAKLWSKPWVSWIAEIKALNTLVPEFFARDDARVVEAINPILFGGQRCDGMIQVCLLYTSRCV